jgi:hypothetical protein
MKKRINLDYESKSQALQTSYDEVNARDEAAHELSISLIHLEEDIQELKRDK